MLSNFKLFGSHFGFLAAILYRSTCCFCVIISNFNIHCFKHLKIKKPVGITTLNSKLRKFLVIILLYLSPMAAILNFWRPSWIFVDSSGIEQPNLRTSLLTMCQNHAMNKNYRLKFQIRVLLCPDYQILLFKGVLWHSGGHLGFQEMLNGESFTSRWILFCAIRRTIIR